MKTNTTQNILQDWQQKEALLFSKVEIPYEITKEQVWNFLQSRIDGEKSPLNTKPSFVVKPALIKHLRLVTTLAATVILLVSILSFMRFYTKTVVSNPGEQLTFRLPDNSEVKLNAQSTFKFQPYWWFAKRKIEFLGEGFFEVTPGKKFEVFSANGSTEVLGTSFNIFSRNQSYQVTCFTGKVKVVSPSSQEAILTPDYQAVIGENGVISVVKLSEPESVTSWKDSMFNFTSVPLQLVIQEIERQYNISVILNTNFEFVYTGYFSKDKPVEEVLNLICKPFGLTFVKKSDNQYLIVQQ